MGVQVSALSLKSIAVSLHRWLGLVLMPVFLLVIISGGIMALKPIAEDPAIAGTPSSIEITTVLSTLERVDPTGLASQVSVTGDGQALVVTSPAANGPNGVFAFDNAEAVPGAGPALDIFGLVKSFHKNLLIGAGTFILGVTLIMLALILIGPLLGWLRMRNTPLGWHLSAGWLVLPLLILSPLTGILMSFHIDTGPALVLQPASPSLSLARGIEIAAQDPAFNSIISIRRFKSGSVMMEAVTDKGQETYVVDGSHKATALSGPGWVKSLHEGTWAGAWSGLINLVTAIALTLLTVTGFLSWFRRWRQSTRRQGSQDADILVAHASQTGTAAQLAHATFRALESGGAKVACMSLAAVHPDDLKRYRHVLIIAATAGEGELAEPGRAFLKAVTSVDTSFSILALGDRRYPHFCAGGESLRSALLAAGARETVEMVRADGAPQVAWNEWIDALQTRLALSFGEIEAPKTDQPVTVRLIERKRLDHCAAHDTNETWQLIFATDRLVTFRPGDLLMLAPGEGETERCYSIGNSTLVEPGKIALTVSRVAWVDHGGVDHLGSMSNLLCRTLPLGSELSGTIRRHPHFNLPEDPATPIIMVATGCGIAPFTGFFAERSQASGEAGPAWLMFGNRHRDGDYLYREALEDWQKQGVLTRLSTAFSRDEGRYVTEHIVANGREIVTLLRDEGAVLYVCGRTRLGKGVESALVQALVANDNVSERQAEETVRKWKAAGSLRQDLFD